MPTPTRRLRARRAGAYDFTDVASEAAHAINNALGVLFGAEYLIEREAGGAHAEARSSLRDATAKLQRCTDALNLLAQRPADLCIPRTSPSPAIPDLLERLCGDAGLPLRWRERTVDPQGELAVDRELLRWLVSCALFSLGRGAPRDVEIQATLRPARRALELQLEATGTAIASPESRPNLPALALRGQRAALAEAGVRILRGGNGHAQSVRLTFPTVNPAKTRTAR